MAVTTVTHWARATRSVTARAATIALAAVLIAACTLAACTKETAPATGVDASEGREGSGLADAPPPVPRAAIAAREQLTSSFAQTYAAWLGEQVDDRAIAQVLVEPPAGISLRRGQFLAKLYSEREMRPFLTTDQGTLSPVGRAARATLASVEVHALEADRYWDDSLRAALRAWGELAPLGAGRSAPALTPELQEALDSITRTEEFEQAEDRIDYALNALFSDTSILEEPVPGLRRGHRARLRAERALAGQRAITEALLIDRALSYAYDQSHFNTASLDDELTEPERKELVAGRMAETFEALASAQTEEAARQIFRMLEPPHPQYRALMAERARYEQIVEDGGWDEVPRRSSIAPGRENSGVARLQERLAAEAYYDGEVDGVYDDEVEQAVRAYQETHQMPVTGEPHSMFWGSLNIPAEQRLAQIELTMQRWRESRLGREDNHFIMVNIPDFHAEVWRDGERQMRFRIVAGNTEQRCDPETGMIEYANATPIQRADMTYVVLNPYWNVPSRIVDEELLPELLENEFFFKQEGYQRFVTPDGYEMIRQLPGEDNALGLVKFMFPNPHNTYMHDTPHKVYFDRSIRAYSHGCMRVQDPMSLLEYILRTDGQWDEERVARIYEEGEETAISLREPIPVIIEYYVVRVDDDGRANFLADIYRYDRDRLNPPNPEDLRCEPEARPELELTLSDDGRVLYRDAEGNIFEPASIGEDGTPLGPDGQPLTAEPVVEGDGAVGGEVPDEDEIPEGAEPPIQGDLGP